LFMAQLAPSHIRAANVRRPVEERFKARVLSFQREAACRLEVSSDRPRPVSFEGSAMRRAYDVPSPLKGASSGSSDSGAIQVRRRGRAWATAVEKTARAASATSVLSASISCCSQSAVPSTRTRSTAETHRAGSAPQLPLPDLPPPIHLCRGSPLRSCSP